MNRIKSFQDLIDDLDNVIIKIDKINQTIREGLNGTTDSKESKGNESK